MTLNARSSSSWLRTLLGVSGLLPLSERARRTAARLASKWPFARQRIELPDNSTLDAPVPDNSTLEAALLETDALERSIESAPTLTPEELVNTRIFDTIAAKLQRPLSRADRDLTFSALGLDSITLLELGAKLEDHFGISLADFAAYEHPTPAALASHVAALIVEEARPKSHSSPPTGDLISPEHGSASHSFELPSWPRREAG